MVGFKKDLNRAEFLKKSSPIADKNTKSVSAPPLFSEEEKVSILGNSEDLKDNKTKVHLGKFAFWKDWKETQYTYASVGLALLLVGYVGMSVSGLGNGDTSLNATLTAPETEQEQSQELEEEGNNEVIDSEVVDSSIVIEEIQKDPSIEESEDITDYIFENYDI